MHTVSSNFVCLIFVASILIYLSSPKNFFNRIDLLRQINVDECVDAAVDVGLLLHIIKWNWFNCCKVFCWFYCEDPKDTVFSEFCFLVFMTCFQLLLALIILEISSIVCLHLRLWFLSLLFVETIILIFSNSFLCLFLLFKFNRTKNCFSVACIPNFQTFF